MIEYLQKSTNTLLVLTGANFERGVNEDFLKIHPLPAYDLAGYTSILELPGLIRSCSLFISTDSDPYHMAVALKVPTLAVFVKENPKCYHNHPWVRCVVLSKKEYVGMVIKAGMGFIGLIIKAYKDKKL